jgi:phosphatidylserine/phosphatidylglycerophosphate/cardiolipin synthase-like enzyme
LVYQWQNVRVKIENVLLVTNDQYLPMLLDLLSQAKKSIDIIAYSFAIGSAAGKLSETGAPFKIAEKLIQIKKQLGTKISIRLYIEGYRETADRNLITAKYLERAGIHVRLGTTHAKGFCIDGRYVLFGSTNLTNQSIVKNNETNLLFDDKSAAKGFMKYF